MLQRWLVSVTPITGGTYMIDVAAPDEKRAIDLACHTREGNRTVGLVWKAKAKMLNPTSDNVDKPLLYVYYADLAETETPNALRRECPVCAAGRLLLRRDEATLKVLPEDNCILCGQQVRFLDYHLIGRGDAQPKE